MAEGIIEIAIAVIDAELWKVLVRHIINNHVWRKAFARLAVFETIVS